MNKCTQRLLIGLTSLGVSMPSWALSIEQAWQASKQFDPTYQQAQLDTQISAINIDRARSQLKPNISAQANANWDAHGNNVNDFSVGVSQTLWDSAKWSQLDSGKAQYLAAKLLQQKAHNELAAKVITTYLSLANAYADKQLAIQKRDEGKKILRITQQRYAAGLLTNTDVEDMQANSVDEEALILQAQAQVDDFTAQLTTLVNMTIDKVDEINSKTISKPPMKLHTTEQWLTLARNSSPELLAAKQTLKARQFDYKQAKYNYYPTLEGNVNYSNDDQRNNDDLNAGITLHVPIDLNGATTANVQTANLNLAKAKQDVRQVTIQLQQSITRLVNLVAIDWQRVEMAEQQVKSRQRALASKQKVYGAGLVDASDVIAAHNNVFNSKNNLQSLLYQYWQDRVALLQAAGQLDDDVIAQVSQALSS